MKKFLAIFSFFALFGLFSQTSQAYTINVTHNLDGAQGDSCTFREALTHIDMGATDDGCSVTGSFDNWYVGSYFGRDVYGSLITFDPSITSPITMEINPDPLSPLSTGSFVINGDVQIRGNGVSSTIIDANLLDRVLEIYTGTVHISDLTIENGNVFGSGAGIYNYSRLVLQNVDIRNNRTQSYFTPAPIGASNGGGIYNNTNGLLAILDSRIYNNSAENGGGIANDWYTVIFGTSIFENEARSEGSGIYSSRTLDIQRNSNIYQNTSTELKAAISSIKPYENRNFLSIKDSIINNNSGIGVYSSGNFEIKDTRISDNQGSGIHYDSDGSYTSSIWNSSISRNTATSGAGINISKGILNINSNTTIENNEAIGNEDTKGCGGGIQTIDGNLSIHSSTIESNIASDCGAGIYQLSGNTSIRYSHILYNKAEENGGGVMLESGEMDIFATPIRFNYANKGGAIYNKYSEIHPTLNFAHADITYNGYDFEKNIFSITGGGIFTEKNTTTKFENATISLNHSDQLGAGLNNSGETHFNFSTIYKNQPQDEEAAGIFNTYTGRIAFGNSIIARNGSESNCLSLGYGIYSQTYNFVWNGLGRADTSCQIGDTASEPNRRFNDYISTDPGLDNLPGFNNHYTKTVKLFDYSAAVDVIPSCTLRNDQRFAERINRCDSGAYEYVEGENGEEPNPKPEENQLFMEEF